VPAMTEGLFTVVTKGRVVGKSITTNPGYFSSGRFLNGEGVKRLLFPQLGSLVKVKRF
jgi:hypothetical protein